MKAIWVVLLTTLCFSTTTSAQDSIVDQDVRVNGQFWLDYNFTSPLKEDQNIRTQIGFRKITPNIYNRFLGISTWNIKNQGSIFKSKKEAPIVKSFHLGAGMLFTQNIDNKNNFELRLIQGFKFEIPTIKPVILYNYFRLEQRFQNSFDNSGWKAAYRLRYRVSTILSWNKHYLSFAKGLYVPLNAELFVNLKRADRFNDLIRISPGIGYRLDDSWRFEFYLIFNRTKNITETNNKSSDFIFRLRVFNSPAKKEEQNILEEEF